MTIKKLLYFVFAAAAVTMMACGSGNKSEQAAESAAEEVVDTIAIEANPAYYTSARIVEVDSATQVQNAENILELVLAKPMPQNGAGQIAFKIVYHDADGKELHKSFQNDAMIKSQFKNEIKNEAGEAIQVRVVLPLEKFREVKTIEFTAPQEVLDADGNK